MQVSSFNSLADSWIYNNMLMIVHIHGIWALIGTKGKKIIVILIMFNHVQHEEAKDTTDNNKIY